MRPQQDIVHKNQVFFLASACIAEIVFKYVA